MRLKPTIPTPGHAAALRGAVAARPWHDKAVLREVATIADTIAGLDLVRELLGPDLDVQVKVSESGRGIVFIVEPAP